MMNRLVIERAYESILPYASPEMKELVTKQLPAVEQAIDEEIEQFTVELGEYVDQQVAKEVEAIQQDIEQHISRIKKGIEALNANNQGIVELTTAANELKQALDDTKQYWNQAGEQLRGVVLKSVKLSGIPIG